MQPYLSVPSRALALRNLEGTRERALHLMQSLGEQELGRALQLLGWQFVFDRAKRRLGSCRWPRRSGGQKQITVSGHYAARMGPAYADEAGLIVIEDVIRHEIAHAVDFETRGRSDHGTAWKAICRRVGADPSRAYESADGVPALPGKYLARCGTCGRETTYYRIPTRPRACRFCCETHSNGQYDDRFKLDVYQRY